MIRPLHQCAQFLVPQVQLNQFLSRVLLVAPDLLQGQLVVLLRDARTRLPTLDALGQDFKDPAERGKFTADIKLLPIGVYYAIKQRLCLPDCQ